MRDLTKMEIQAISGAVGPTGAVAGAVVGVAGYIGTQTGAGQTATWTGAAGAGVAGGILGFFTPATTAQAAGTAMGAFYGGLGGGYMMRSSGPDSGAA